MKSNVKGALHSRWSFAVHMLLVVALIVLIAPVAPSHAAVPRAQSVLLAMAVEHPDATIGVIVQKTVRDNSPERLVARLGGVVGQDLAIINAFAAQVPAQAVATLAIAGGVRWVSLDAPLEKTSCNQCVDTAHLANSYVQAIGADRLWNESPYWQGQGVGVAIVDSGIATHDDLNQATGQRNTSRVVVSARFVKGTNTGDGYGHGTHVAGIVGGNGVSSDGARIGVAPRVNLINVKVSDTQGAGTIADVIEGLQWVYNNRHVYNIRVVNLSLHSSTPESYQTSPLDAAVEVLWFNRVVVVVAAGNSARNGIGYPPANDPFVITVGATDDRGTPSTSDDSVAAFSAYGRTESGFAKPDLVAPGTNLISLLAGPGVVLAQQYPDHIADGSARGADDYFRMSGTSMSSAVTAGAAALLIQSNPSLTPDQVKYRLTSTARRVRGEGAGAGYLDIYAAVHSSSTRSANTGTKVNQLIRSGSSLITWSSLNWESLNWESLNWESLNWESLNWESLNWDSVNWE